MSTNTITDRSGSFPIVVVVSTLLLVLRPFGGRMETKRMMRKMLLEFEAQSTLPPYNTTTTIVGLFLNLSHQWTLRCRHEVAGMLCITQMSRLYYPQRPAYVLFICFVR